MSEEIQLPEGVTFNKNNEYSFDIELNQEEINSTKCQYCELILHSILYTDNKRHSGAILAMPYEQFVWKNSLPKDRIRAVKILDEKLVEKLDNHVKRNHND